MKVAFHFNAAHPSIHGLYGYKAERLLFGVLLKHRNLNLSSKVLRGFTAY